MIITKRQRKAGRPSMRFPLYFVTMPKEVSLADRDRARETFRKIPNVTIVMLPHGWTATVPVPK